MAKKRRFTTCGIEQHSQPSLSHGSPNRAQSCGASQPTQPHGSSQTTHLPRASQPHHLLGTSRPSNSHSSSQPHEVEDLVVQANELFRVKAKPMDKTWMTKSRSSRDYLGLWTFCTLLLSMRASKEYFLQVRDSCNGSLDQISPQAHQGSSHASHDIEYSD